jgi:D-alanyl-D-alanine carboxypeptidase
MTKRQKAVLRRNLFLTVCALALAGIMFLAIYSISAIAGGDKKDVSSKENTSLQSSEIASSTESDTSSEETPSFVFNEETPHDLDPNFESLKLVNGWNSLPEDYDYEGNLTTIPKKYIKGSLTQIDKDIWPYLQAMLDDARAEGIDIGVWSPYRSYATQKWLFEKQVQKQIDNGVAKENAEDVAATIVARPGTSEHNTGLALDINCANHSFKETKAYKWLQENAEDYGFIMRYAEDKQEKTGVIYESWHWRFVGIKAAHEINELEMCLEEYVEYKNNQ